MKKVLLFAAVVGLFAACNKPATETGTESANENQTENSETLPESSTESLS